MPAAHVEAHPMVSHAHLNQKELQPEPSSAQSEGRDLNGRPSNEGDSAWKRS